MKTKTNEIFSSEELSMSRETTEFNHSESSSTEPYINDAVEFLRALAEVKDISNEKFTFQVFDDSDSKRKELSQHFSGTLKDCWSKLINASNCGCGVFVMINEGDLKGRSEANVIRVRSLFVDLDGSPIESVTSCESPPSIVVESSPGRFHAYWIVEDCPLEKFRVLQKALIKRFSGDPVVHDLPRVMRLPGFFHRKMDPARSKLISIDQTRSAYRIESLIEGLKLLCEEEQNVEVVSSKSTISEEKISELLEYIDPDCDYETWMKVGLAIHAEFPNESGFTLFDDWSKKGSKYKSQEMQSKWESFGKDYSGKKVTIRTLIKFAKLNGFEGSVDGVGKKPKKEDRSPKEYIDFVYSLPQVKDIKREFFSDELVVFTKNGNKYPLENFLRYIESHAVESGGFTLSNFPRHLSRHLHDEKKPELLVNIPEWDGLDRLREICACIKAKDFDEDELYQLLLNWGVTIFLRLENPGIQPYVLVVKGPQGVGKDTLFEALVGGFGPYFIELNLNNIAEAERELHTAAVFKITEFDRSAKQSAQVKRIITTNKTTVRLAFDRRPQERFVRASYAATCNADDIFTDVTGNRRYWVIDLEFGGFAKNSTSGIGNSTFSKKVEKDYPGMFCRANFEEERLQILAQFKALAQRGEHKPSQKVIDKMNDLIKALTPEDPYDTLVDVWDENVTSSISNPMYGSSNDTARSRGYLTNAEITQRRLIERMCEETGLSSNQIRQALKKEGRFQRIGKERRYTFEVPNVRKESSHDEGNTLDRLMDDDDEPDTFNCQ